MSITANQGPYYSYGAAPVASGGASDNNPHRGPSLFDQGLGIMDPRLPFAYQPGGASNKAYGWLGATRCPVLDVVPATLAAGAIAASQTVTQGTPMTLVTSSGSGILVGQSVVNAATGANVTGLLAIGTAGGAVSFDATGWNFTCSSANATAGATYTNNGATFTVLTTIASGTSLTTSVAPAGASPTNAASNTLTKVTGTGDSTITFTNAVPTSVTGGTNIWDPTKMLARVISVTGATSNTGGTFQIKGYDVYGYPMTENIVVGSGVTTPVLGAKAWKYIASVTPTVSTDTTHNYSVDTTDTIGLALRADSWAYVDLYYGSPATPANNVVTAATGFTAAVTTTPATTTTGDVRGTYALQSASDGTKRLTIFVSPSVANIGSALGLTGVSQV